VRSGFNAFMIGSHGVERETTMIVPSDHLKIIKLTD